MSLAVKSSIIFSKFCLPTVKNLHSSLASRYLTAPASQKLFYNAFSTSSRAAPGRKVWQYALVGVLGGGAASAGYTYHRSQQPRVPIVNEGTGTTSIILSEKPDTPVSRKVVSPTDHSNLHLVLYQYQTCPFCCKVRAFLDYHGFSYDIIEVNPVLRQQMKWSTYKKVPILLAKVENGYQQLNDSTMIVSALASYMNDPHQGLTSTVNCYPSVAFTSDDGTVKNEIMNKYFLMFQDDKVKGKSKEDILSERKWRKWADDVLVHMLSPNVYRTRTEALQAFNWFSEVGQWDKLFTSWERNLVIYVGATAMWMIGKRLKKRHNLKDNVRESLYDECNHWAKTIKKQNTEFLGGNSPNLADLAVYGVLNSIEGCDAFKDVLQNTNIGPWYKSMKQVVTRNAGVATTQAR